MRIDARGLAKSLPHAQHLHFGAEARNECPNVFDDANNDLRINVAEGVPDYGPILKSLTTSGDTSPKSGLAVDRFPTTPKGVEKYERVVNFAPGAVTPRHQERQGRHRDPRCRPQRQPHLRPRPRPASSTTARPPTASVTARKPHNQARSAGACRRSRTVATRVAPATGPGDHEGSSTMPSSAPPARVGQDCGYGDSSGRYGDGVAVPGPRPDVLEATPPADRPEQLVAVGLQAGAGLAVPTDAPTPRPGRPGRRDAAARAPREASRWPSQAR